MSKLCSFNIESCTVYTVLHGNIFLGQFSSTAHFFFTDNMSPTLASFKQHGWVFITRIITLAGPSWRCDSHIHPFLKTQKELHYKKNVNTIIESRGSLYQLFGIKWWRQETGCVTTIIHLCTTTWSSALTCSRYGLLSCESIPPPAHLKLSNPIFRSSPPVPARFATASFKVQTARTGAKKRTLGKSSRLMQSTCCKFSFFAIKQSIILGVVMGTRIVVRKALWSEHERRKLQTPSEQLHSWLHFKAGRAKKAGAWTRLDGKNDTCVFLSVFNAPCSTHLNILLLIVLISVLLSLTGFFFFYHKRCIFAKFMYDSNWDITHPVHDIYNKQHNQYN